MKKNILFTGISIFLSMQAYSQYLHFAKVFEATGSISLGYNATLSTGIDDNRNFYSAGVISNTVDFDPGIGIQNMNGSNNTIYISKLDSLGNYIWVKQIDGASYDQSANILVNRDGSFFFSGSSDVGVDLDPGQGVYTSTQKGFISKFNNQGNFVWAKEIDCFPEAIKVDVLGNIYITGDFSGTVDFDPGTGVASLTSLNTQDPFILKLDSLGNFVWVKKFNSTFNHHIDNLILDNQANLYLRGSFTGQLDADPNSGTYNITTQGDQDVFIVKLDSSGDLSWAKSITVNTPYQVSGTCGVDLAGNVYLNGSFANTVDFDPGSNTFNVTSSTSNDSYFLKLDASGNFIWVKTLNSSFIGDMKVNGSGDITVSGSFSSVVDFNPDPLITTSMNANSGANFLCKMDSSGSLVWVRQFGISNTPLSGGLIAMDNGNNAYLTGYGSGNANWDPGASNYTTFLPPNSLYVTKYSATPVSILNVGETQKATNLTIYPNPTNRVLNVKMDNSNNTAEPHLYSITGTDLTSKINITKNQQSLTLDLFSIPSGTYILSIGEERSVVIKR